MAQIKYFFWNMHGWIRVQLSSYSSQMTQMKRKMRHFSIFHSQPQLPFFSSFLDSLYIYIGFWRRWGLSDHTVCLLNFTFESSGLLYLTLRELLISKRLYFYAFWGNSREERARSVIPLGERWQCEVGFYFLPILPGCSPSTWEVLGKHR